MKGTENFKGTIGGGKVGIKERKGTDMMMDGWTLTPAHFSSFSIEIEPKLQSTSTSTSTETDTDTLRDINLYT